MNPGLYIIGTPIGHLEDISRRALTALQEVEFILAEDTRHSRLLLARYQIRTPLESCHRFNEAARAAMTVRRIGAGAAVGLVTNAGMPGISDPGARIAAACRRAGLAVSVLPGPSAATAAVALSGFGGGGFACEGFLPRKPGPRRRRLLELAGWPAPVALFESPFRFVALLDELAAICPDRDLFVGRELTKLNEETAWGTAAELRNRFAGRPVRGELTVVLSPAAGRGRSRDDQAAAEPVPPAHAEESTP